MLMHVFIFESALMKTAKLANLKGLQAIGRERDMLRLLMYAAAEKLNSEGKQAIYAFAEGDEQRMMLLGLKRFTKMQPYNLKNARRRVAQTVIDANSYCF